jgi:hypothetical protein
VETELGRTGLGTTSYLVGRGLPGSIVVEYSIGRRLKGVRISPPGEPRRWDDATNASLLVASKEARN